MKNLASLLLVATLAVITTVASVSAGEAGGASATPSESRLFGYMIGPGFIRKVEYSVVQGLAVVEGDMVIGGADEVAQQTEAIDAKLESGVDLFGLGIRGRRFRWPNRSIFYCVDERLANSSAIAEAVSHWNDQTSMSLTTNELLCKAPVGPVITNLLIFTPRSGICAADVGWRQGGTRNYIYMDPQQCGFGQIVHEIGHAVGLFREQSRADRDRHVRVLWENILPSAFLNFEQQIHRADDIGPYDYESIMHYGPFAFSKNGNPTIETVPVGTPIGQRAGLSPGDIAAVQDMYP